MKNLLLILFLLCQSVQAGGLIIPPLVPAPEIPIAPLPLVNYIQTDAQGVVTLVTGATSSPVGATVVSDVDIKPVSTGSKVVVAGATIAAPIKPFDLVAAKDDELRNISRFHKDALESFLGSPNIFDLVSAFGKSATAVSILNGKALLPLEVAYFNGAGILAGAAQTAWANATIAKAAQYNYLLGTADGLKDRAIVAILAATDEPTLRAAVLANRAAVSSFLATQIAAANIAATTTVAAILKAAK